MNTMYLKEMERNMSVPKDAACSMPHDHQRSLHDLCRKYMHYHVVLK
ncbi:hypothetical protein PO124_28120 [Bacillus licheniformis]|nr:hypothetical protein [Bacillus licheniformis]